MSGEAIPVSQAASPVLPRTVVLVGLMGAGKSCVGRRLAARLGVDFVDADQEIEKAAGQTVSEIFSHYGEPAFRELERKVMARLMSGPPCILAAGGGAFMDPETRDLVKTHGLSLWLRADLDLLVKRTAGRDHRPLLKTGDPRDILGRLIDQRYPVYAQADVIVDSADQPADVTVDAVQAALEVHLAAPSTP
ncbi:MAG TPA: shikimate kinase [Candidatus Sulfotelmatobacter sp.]|jgi:shikimate kinase|nr:shikimate kinase [Candidatus Sulfotelmatobacter sp.]